MESKFKDKLLEWLIVIFPVFYIISISIWHAFGVNGVQPWSILYFLSNHLFIIYLAILLYYICGIPSLRRIMVYMVIPYTCIKIVYQVLLWILPILKGHTFFTYMWSIICVITFLIGAIVTWTQLRKIG